MNRKRLLSLLIGTATLAAILCWAGWHTWIGRAVRGVSTAAFANRTNEAFQSVSFELHPGRGEIIRRRFDDVPPHSSVSVEVKTHDLIVNGVVAVQGDKVFTYEDGDLVTPIEAFVVAVDADGQLTSGYGKRTD